MLQVEILCSLRHSVLASAGGVGASHQPDFWATVCKTVRFMLSELFALSCHVCLSVTLGVL